MNKKEEKLANQLILDILKSKPQKYMVLDESQPKRYTRMLSAGGVMKAWGKFVKAYKKLEAK